MRLCLKEMIPIAKKEKMVRAHYACVKTVGGKEELLSGTMKKACLLQNA